MPLARSRAANIATPAITMQVATCAMQSHSLFVQTGVNPTRKKGFSSKSACHHQTAPCDDKTGAKIKPHSADSQGL